MLLSTASAGVTLGVVGSSPNSSGASLSGQVLTLQPADGTHPGVLTSGAQTIGGDKTFTGKIIFSSGGVVYTSDNVIGLFGGTGAGAGVSLVGDEADGASAIGILLNNAKTLAAGGSKLLSVQNNSVEKLSISRRGDLNAAAGVYAGAANAFGFNNNDNIFLGGAGAGVVVRGSEADMASAVAVVIDNSNALSTGGSLLLSLRNAGSQKAFIDINGAGRFAAGTVISNMTYNSGQISSANGIQLATGVANAVDIYGNLNSGAGGSTPNVALRATQSVAVTDSIAGFFTNYSTLQLSVLGSGKLVFTDYSDQSGAPGNCTANTITGKAAIASAASTCVVSDTRVTANSIIMIQMLSDGTGVANVVLDSKAAGTSFTVKAINGTGIVTVTTGNTLFSWLIIN